MTTCAVRNCQNNSSDDVKFYKFPAYEYWQNKWLEAIGRKSTEINVRTGKHFFNFKYKLLRKIISIFKIESFYQCKNNFNLQFYE